MSGPNTVLLPAFKGRVSIVIPAYNGKAWIGEAIDSCLAQSHEDTEVVVVDDGSSDGTAAILASYGSRIRLVTQANQGTAGARNTGVRAATGEFIALMDSDDICLPDRVRIEAAVLASDPQLALVSSDFTAFNSEDGDFETSHAASYYRAVNRLGGMRAIYRDSVEVAVAGARGRFTVRQARVHEQLLNGNFVHPPTSLFRREIFDRTGPFDTSLRYSMEYEFFMRAARQGAFAYVDAPLLRYRRSPHQLSHTAGGGRMPLETAAIFQRLRREDAALYATHKPLFRRRIGEALLDASETLAPTEKARALGLWLRAARYRAPGGALARCLAKIVIPRPMIVLGKRILRPATPERLSPDS